MRKIIAFTFLALLFAGLSSAILKVPSTTVETNVSITKLNTTPIIKVNIEANGSNETPTTTKPELISDVPKWLPKNVTEAPIVCVACNASPQLINITGVTNTQPCNASEVSEYLDHSSYHGHKADFNKPDYLNLANEDCDLLSLYDEITEDLNAKLQIVDQIEAKINATENESQALVQRGKSAINCLRTAEHGQLGLSTTYPPFPSIAPIGNQYIGGSVFSYILNKLKNFHIAYENVHTGYNYTNASMENLENITLGLVDFCRGKVCVFPEDKDYYEDLLEHEAYGASYYANSTKHFIDDARGFAQSYNDLKDGIDQSECMDFIAQSTQYAPWQNMNMMSVSNETPKQVISPVKLAKNFSGVKNVTLIGGPAPKYIIQSKVKKKMLWVFDVEVETKAEVNAENGQIISEEKPWWSFLLTN